MPNLRKTRILPLYVCIYLDVFLGELGNNFDEIIVNFLNGLSNLCEMSESLEDLSLSFLEFVGVKFKSSSGGSVLSEPAQKFEGVVVGRVVAISDNVISEDGDDQQAESERVLQVEEVSKGVEAQTGEKTNLGNVETGIESFIQIISNTRVDCLESIDFVLVNFTYNLLLLIEVQ